MSFHLKDDYSHMLLHLDFLGGSNNETQVIWLLRHHSLDRRSETVKRSENKLKTGIFVSIHSSMLLAHGSKVTSSVFQALAAL